MNKISEILRALPDSAGWSRIHPDIIKRVEQLEADSEALQRIREAIHTYKHTYPRRQHRTRKRRVLKV